MSTRRYIPTVNKELCALVLCEEKHQRSTFDRHESGHGCCTLVEDVGSMEVRVFVFNDSKVDALTSLR